MQIAGFSLPFDDDVKGTLVRGVSDLTYFFFFRLMSI